MSFENEIKPLFREFDRDQMEWAFDLWSHADVKANASCILTRLEQGEMPCDTPWMQERVAAFRAWVESGAPE